MRASTASQTGLGTELRRCGGEEPTEKQKYFGAHWM